MRILNLLGVFLMFICLSGCSPSSSVDEPVPTERTAQDVINDFKNFNLQSGINDLKLESLVSGVYWNFRVIVPESANEGNLRPLVMTFHGASNGAPTAHQNTGCYDEPGLAEFDAYIISPNAGTGEWYDNANQQMVLALLDLAKSNWFVDVNKVVATGYSNGGNASWFYADFYPEHFSASIPMASSYNPERNDGTVPKINVPMYVIHGENDELFPVAQTQEFVDQSKSAGSNIEFVIVSGLTHFKPCEYVNALKDAVTWVKTEVWN